MRSLDEGFELAVGKGERMLRVQVLVNGVERRSIEALQDLPFAVADQKHLARCLELQQHP